MVKVEIAKILIELAFAVLLALGRKSTRGAMVGWIVFGVVVIVVAVLFFDHIERCIPPSI